MAATPGDDKQERQLELPSLRLPALRRRRRPTRDTATGQQGRPAGRRAEPSGSGPPLPSTTSVPGRAAAAATGLVVGAGGAAATYAAMAACEAVRGVSTCGGGPGSLVLVAIVVLMVLLGSLLLRLLGVTSGLSTSFLGVGVVAVVTMLLLLEVIFSPWMFVLVPLLGAAAYLLAHWVTTRFEGEDTGRRDWR